MSNPNVSQPQSPAGQQPVAPQSSVPQVSTAQPTVPLQAPAQAPYPTTVAPQLAPGPVAPAAPVGPVGPVAGPSLTTLSYTNTYALLAIIFAFISPIAGIIFGHLGLSQIKRTGDQGRGLALTGMILSYASFAFLIVFVFVYVGFILMIFGMLGASLHEFSGLSDYSSSTPGF